MANERAKSANAAFMTGFVDATIDKVVEAKQEGRAEDSRSAAVRAAGILNAIGEIGSLYDRIDEIHRLLGLPVLPADIFGSFVQTVSADEAVPAISETILLPFDTSGEDPNTAGDSGFAVFEGVAPDLGTHLEEADVSEDLPVFLPAAVVTASVFPELRPTTPIPVLRPDPRPTLILAEPMFQRRVSAETLNGLPLEDKVIRAVFGLNLEGTQLYYDTFASSVNAVFGDSFPPRALNPEKNKEEFGKALRQQGHIVAGFLASVGAVDMNPNLATDEQILITKKIRDYLLEEGYPDNLTADDLSVISHRKWGFDLKTFLINLANRKDSKPAAKPVDAGAGLDDPFNTGARDKRAHPGNRGSLDPELRDGVSLGASFRTVRKGPSYHVPETSSDGVRAVLDKRATSGSSEQINQIDRILGDAIFAIDTEKAPVNASLALVAEKVFAKELEGLEKSARDARIRILIETKITPYIADRMRALVVTSNPSANATVKQRTLAGEIEFWSKKYEYPSSLSISEIGRLMSKQITLPELLALKNGIPTASAGRNTDPETQTPSASPAQGDSGRAENGVNHLKRVDRLSDAQRAYLDVVFERGGDGQIAYTTKALAIAALYPKEYKRAQENPEDKHAMALLLAHFGRTGKKVKQMLEDLFATGTGPSELRARIQAIKNSADFKGLPDSTIIALSQR